MTRLVEAIVSRLTRKGRAGQSRPVPSKPAPAPQRASASSEPLTKRFPIGLDLGADSVKWIQLGRTNGQTSIVAFGSQPLTPPSSPSDTEGQAQLREALRRIVAEHGLSGEVVLSLPLEAVTLRVLKMPVLPEAELQQAIRWQIEQSLPPQVSYEDFTVDHLVLEQIGGPWESRVLVASAPRQLVMAMVDHARSVGLKPLAMDIDPVAVAACVSFQHRFQPEETLLLLHLGSSSASLSIVAKQQLAFSRSILTTDHSLTQAVADHLQVSQDQADTLKRTHGLLSSPEVAQTAPSSTAPAEALAVARALASPLENLLVDMLHAFKGFSYQVTQSQIERFDRIYLSGEGVQLPGLMPWLKARLNIPVELVNPLAIFPLRESADSAKPVSEPASQFAIAMGLAVSEVPNP